MFIINTTTSVEFDQNLWCLSQILTDFENLWEFGSNTTDIGQIPQILSGDFGWRVVLCTKFQVFDQISGFWPNFWISTKFQDVDPLLPPSSSIWKLTKLASGAKYSLFQSVSILSGCVMKYKLSACTLPHCFLQFWYRQKLFFSWLPFRKPGYWVCNFSDWWKFKITLAERFTQVMDSIPWVRCASGNV